MGNYKMCDILKTPGRARAKRTNLGLRVKYMYLVYAGYFLPLSVQSQFEVIWCMSNFSDFQQPCISKTADHRGKLIQIWALGGLIIIIKIICS